MPLERVVDRSGEGMMLLRYKHYFAPPDYTDAQLSSVALTDLRHDDVLICSYPKSGCHWFWEIIRILLSGTTQLSADDKEPAMLERSMPEVKASLPSPRILNTHVYHEDLPATLTQMKVKVVFLVRNPKDVAVSFYNHHWKLPEYDYKGSWDTDIQRFLDGQVDYGSVFAYTRDMEQWMGDNPTHPVIVCHYENMKQNFRAEMRRLGDFLERSPSEELLTRAESRCHIDTMRVMKGKNFTDVDGNPIMYRKGLVGDWKNSFTVAQNEAFDDVMRSETRGLKTKFVFEV